MAHPGLTLRARVVSPACKFTWDAENRMTEARNFSGVSQVKLGYDAYGRLVRREHTSPLATGAGRAKVELYAHVGGLRVAVYSGNTSTKAVTLIRAIAWGPDLSGTVGGAGGIGGLLSVRETSASTSSRKGLTMLLGHDAKGDITSVWSADGAYLGGYVTQAFGQVAVLSGSAAYLSENQWRIASKPLEWLTGYSHWGRRWYSPFLGRWVSRDPIGEAGGVNLYGSCGNDMVSALDPWGEQVKACFGFTLAWDTEGKVSFAVTASADDTRRVSENCSMTGGIYASIYTTRLGTSISRTGNWYNYDTGVHLRADFGAGAQGNIPIYTVNMNVPAANLAPYSSGASAAAIINYNNAIKFTRIVALSLYGKGLYAHYSNDAKAAPTFVPESLSSDKSWTGTGIIGCRNASFQAELAYAAFTSEGSKSGAVMPKGNSPLGYYSSNTDLNRNQWILRAGKPDDMIGLYIPSPEDWNIQHIIHDSTCFNPDGSLRSRYDDRVSLRFWFIEDDGFEISKINFYRHK